MSDSTHINFDRRSSRIVKQSKLLKRGSTHSITADGLIVKRVRRRVSISWRGLLHLIVAFWAFKVIAVTNLGYIDYSARTDQLLQGNGVERAAGMVLQADPITLATSNHLNALLSSAADLKMTDLF